MWQRLLLSCGSSELINFNSSGNQKSYLSKQKLVSAAERVFGNSSDIECSSSYDVKKHFSIDQNNPYYTGIMMKMYSGKPCSGPLTVSRLLEFISSKSEKRDGGSSQCPEVVEWYSMIASSLKQNAVYCDVGFDEGHSAALFLLGGFTQNVTVHSFDISGENEKTRSLFRELFPGRFFFHQGDIGETSKSFTASGVKCDVIFYDITIPKTVLLFENAALSTTTVLYHWHFRGKHNRDWFVKEFLKSGRFTEETCMQTRCKFATDSVNKFMVRETCLGHYNH